MAAASSSGVTGAVIPADTEGAANIVDSRGGGVARRAVSRRRTPIIWSDISSIETKRRAGSRSVARASRRRSGSCVRAGASCGSGSRSRIERWKSNVATRTASVRPTV